eukprot:scaffold15671_cov111-Isochrysis_galbana.AAC.4
MSRGGVPHLLANHRKKTLPAGAPYPAAATLSAQQRGAHAAASSGDAALAHACSSRQKAGSPDSGTASAAISSARSASTVGFTPASIIAPADRAASTRETYPSHCARVWPDACAAASRAAQSGGGSSSFPPAAGSGSSPSSTSHWYREQNTIAPNPVREPRARAESSPMSHAAVPAVCSSPAPDASRAPTGVSGLWTSDGGAAPLPAGIGVDAAGAFAAEPRPLHPPYRGRGALRPALHEPDHADRRPLRHRLDSPQGRDIEELARGEGDLHRLCADQHHLRHRAQPRPAPARRGVQVWEDAQRGRPGGGDQKKLLGTVRQCDDGVLGAGAAGRDGVLAVQIEGHRRGLRVDGHNLLLEILDLGPEARGDIERDVL